MDTNTELELPVRSVGNRESLHGFEELDGHSRNLTCVCIIALRKAGRHHIGVSDSFDFVHIEPLDDRIKQGVQPIEEFNNLFRIKEMD
ncbi:unnamed protein product [Dibothriocephalus latus]|uniref:Uncharacterized protein n=1 Tax=Dibothriocephalus latus TaxID=60516 RepID=A0A3P7S2V6_DIBLA|nr:unnamed protein product [Dibothriocephalus latus]